MFAKNSTDYEIESAFRGAREVLSYLSTQSPQAAHYLEILGSLSNAISKRRSKEVPVERNRYVSKLFTFSDSAAEIEEPSAAGQAEVSRSITNFPSVIEGLEDGSSVLNFGQFDSGDICLDWESLSIAQWDSFPFVS